MDAHIRYCDLEGTLPSIASKSIAHRLLILAALSGDRTKLICNNSSDDIEATCTCMRALGAHIKRTEYGYDIEPILFASLSTTKEYVLDCKESGSTLRFLLPVVAALGVQASFVVSGRLSKRPLTDLCRCLADHSVELSQEGLWPLKLAGKLSAGDFYLPGNVSSQYITGVMLAATLLDKPVNIWVTIPVESKPYIDLTLDALAQFGIDIEVSQQTVKGQRYLCYSKTIPQARPHTPGQLCVEGDWSNAAFWLAAGALGGGRVSISGLNPRSSQGDIAILSALKSFGAHVDISDENVCVSAAQLHGIELDVSDIPDLVPPLAAVAAMSQGTTRLYGAARLRLKESDRLETVHAALAAVGINSCILDDSLIISGGIPRGGTIDAAGDHRIAMMGTLLASRSAEPVVIARSECVRKSYPAFFDDFAALGGIVRLSE